MPSLKNIALCFSLLSLLAACQSNEREHIEPPVTTDSSLQVQQEVVPTQRDSMRVIDSAGRFVTESSVVQNPEIEVRDGQGKIVKPTYKAHLRVYTADNVLMEEGDALYDDSLGATFIRYGKWMYYDSTGAKVLERTYQAKP